MKEIVMFCEDVLCRGSVPFLKESYNVSYRDFSLLLSKEGVRLLVANFKDYSNLKVLKYWVFDGGWILKSEPVEVKCVFDKFPGVCNKSRFIKKEFLDNNIKVLNHPDLEFLFKDKFLTYEKFNDISPASILLNDSFEDIVKKIHYLRSKRLHDDLDSNILFFKPRFGHGGKGIIVISGNDFSSLKDIEFKEYIMQPLIKIKSLPNRGLHGLYDLRFVMDSSRIWVCYARVPEKGFISNVGDSVGFGNEVFLEVGSLSEDFISFGNVVNKKLDSFGIRLFSLDFVVGESGKFWLIELNGKPGLVYKTTSSIRRAVETQKATVDVIKRLVN